MLVTRFFLEYGAVRSLVKLTVANGPAFMQTVFVNAEAALQKQIEMYRQMTGEQRLQIALGLHELSCEVARSGIRSQFPNATSEEVEQKLRQRIALARDDE
jgi:hypothetical protein